MRPLLIAYGCTALAFVLMDGAFLALVGPRLYRPEIGPILADHVRLAPALLFYVLYIFGLVFFAVRPGLKDGWTQAALHGLVLGLVAYGTYDLTCQAVLKTWTWKITLIDLAWGAFASAVASGIGAAAARRF
jgi:uncharacterized membrane protein